MKTTSNLVADELRALRARLDLKIEEVARDTKLDKGTIVRYENYQTSPNLDNLEKLLNYYGVSFDIFFNTIYANKHK